MYYEFDKNDKTSRFDRFESSIVVGIRLTVNNSLSDKMKILLLTLKQRRVSCVILFCRE